MARIAYVNGRYRPWQDATVAAEDRGYQFADGVYEVIKVLGGRACDLSAIWTGWTSLAALDIAPPMPRRALQSVLLRRCAGTGSPTLSSISRSRAAARRAIICSRSGSARRW